MFGVLKAPSKTFLVGEYLALKGGPCFILNTEPSFSLQAEPAEPDPNWHVRRQGLHFEKNFIGIHPSSPAGLLLKKYHEFFKDFKLTWVDPHQGLGGFGASSAQFVLCYYLLNRENETIRLDEVLAIYQQCSWDGKGLPPSGADVISQIFGNKICFYEKNRNFVESFSWPFADLDFFLVRTGTKVNTHEHLQKVSSPLDAAAIGFVQQTYEGFRQRNSQLFLEGVSQFATSLKNANLTAPSTLELLEKITSGGLVSVAKGCGALGADVIFIAFEKGRRPHVQTHLKSLNLQIVSDQDQLSEGLMA